MSSSPPVLRALPGLLLCACAASSADPAAAPAPPGLGPPTAEASPAVARPAEPTTSPVSGRPAAFALDAPPGEAAELEPLLRAGIAGVESYFGAPFPASFEVLVHADRAAFEASLPPAWGMTSTECWMVASGTADVLLLLSPQAWRTQACEHDPDDALELQRLLTHELVHVYHGQHNPSPDFTAVSGLDWFVEGVATLASGQLDAERLARARDALAAGRGPARLEDAWRGPERYGFSGALVASLEARLGRAELLALLSATSLDELLGRVGVPETELLERWRAQLLGP